ncbi:hypothetical protein [Microlunatus parietis]|uniref:ABC-2 type transport system permease protein n=1 Tax=Microlunatus parietis TaxID=682979 RepID=A0A7Y9I616_9ACTN|nr:hypothetical protein [Microlunatus parietis]NYE70778.1 ABC-2 type transport system permease protein [Microlunatus parietis]
MITTLHAELIKVRHSRTLRAVLAITIGLSLGITALVTAFGGAAVLAEHQAVDGGGKYEILFFGSTFGVWAYAFFAAGFAAAEFRNGMINYTFAATANRNRVLLAKAILVAAGGLIIGNVTSLINFALTQGMLAATGHPALWIGDPALLRVLLVYIPGQLVVWGVLAVFLGGALRTTTPTVLILLLGSALPVLTAQFLPATWGETVPRWMPGALIESLAGLAVPGSPGYLPLPAAIPALTAWLIIFAVAGLHGYRTRDV